MKAVHTPGQRSDSGSFTFSVASYKKYTHTHTHTRRASFFFFVRLAHDLILSLPLMALWSRRWEKQILYWRQSVPPSLPHTAFAGAREELLSTARWSNKHKN